MVSRQAEKCTCARQQQRTGWKEALPARYPSAFSHLISSLHSTFLTMIAFRCALLGAAQTQLAEQPFYDSLLKATKKQHALTANVSIVCADVQCAMLCVVSKNRAQNAPNEVVDIKIQCDGTRLRRWRHSCRLHW